MNSNGERFTAVRTLDEEPSAETDMEVRPTSVLVPLAPQMRRYYNGEEEGGLHVPRTSQQGGLGEEELKENRRAIGEGGLTSVLHVPVRLFMTGLFAVSNVISHGWLIHLQQYLNAHLRYSHLEISRAGVSCAADIAKVEQEYAYYAMRATYDVYRCRGGYKRLKQPRTERYGKMRVLPG